MKKSLMFGVGVLVSILANATDYSSMSCYDLWYARNAIFADEGYCFKTQRAINVFGRRCAIHHMEG